MRSILKFLALTLSTSALLAGCGGGGSDQATSTSGNSTADTSGQAPSGNTGSNSDTPVALPTTVISSVFDGQTGTSQPLTTFLLSDGSYFMVYSDASTPQKFLGAIMGTGTLSSGSFSSTDALDVSLLGSGTHSADAAILSASYTEKTSLNGTLTYTASNQPRTFVGTYNSSYETLPSLQTLAGVYTGSFATKDLVEENIQLTVNADGTVSGQLPCGCAINATLVPRSDGTAYDATLSFTGGTDAFSGKSFAGNVYADTANHRLYIVGKISGTADNAVFVGSKP